MKRTGKLFALLAAIVMALVLVPRLAWAVSGTLGGNESTDKGTITVANAKKNETYSIYRLFELASFTDSAPGTEQHAEGTESYSYVIRETSGSSWWTFLSTYGSDGSTDGSKPYMISATETSAEKIAAAYFTYEPDMVTIKGPDGVTEISNYHVIKATENFSNNWDSPDNPSTRGNAGVSAGVDFSKTDTSPKYGVIQDFAQAALSYATTNNLGYATNSDGTSANVVNAADDGNLVLMQNAPLGYYLVGTTMGTLVALDTNNNTVNIYEKNDEPSITKTVSKTVDGTYTKNVTADIGDKVFFKTTITAQQGAKNYILHDVMEDGFTYGTDNSSGTPKNNGEIVSVTLTRGSNIYEIERTVTAPTQVSGNELAADKVNWEELTNRDDGCDFEIRFSPDGTLAGKQSTQYYALEIMDGDIITVTYSATVNENATIYGSTETAGNNVTLVQTSGDTGSSSVIVDQKNKTHNNDQRNTNDTILTYGNKSFTTWETATVTTYQFDIVKTKEASSGTSYPLLAGAEFEIYKTTGTAGSNSRTINNVVYNLSDSPLKFDSTDKYRYAGDTAGSTGTTSVLTSTETGEIHIYGLEAGIYILEETKAPIGYNKLAHPIVITVTDGNTDGSIKDTEGKVSIIKVSNSSGATTVDNALWDATVTGDSTKSYDTSVSSQGGIQIVNQTGTELPSTGGLGTKAFYAIGGSLFAASVIFLLTKKRLMQAA